MTLANKIASELARTIFNKLVREEYIIIHTLTNDDIDGAIESIAANIAPLVEAATAALAHVEELREAWRVGAITECDGQGGTRSNRNVAVERKLRAALQQGEARSEH